ncbi:hypothetical protein ACU4GA_13795 [Methylobacterium oryzae CBMB20]
MDAIPDPQPDPQDDHPAADLERVNDARRLGGTLRRREAPR